MPPALPMVDAIFARMLVRYGSAWLAKWEGIPMDAVKADWAQELGGMTRDSIIYALGYLPLEFPPTAAQFKAICLRAPTSSPEVHEIEGPKIEPERLKAELERLHGLLKARGPLEWAYELQERHKQGEALTFAQSIAWRLALAEVPLESINGWFTPIPPEKLPPAMRLEAERNRPVSEAERMNG